MRTLEITTYIGCPVRCEYCPQAKLSARYKGKRAMNLEEFKLFLSKVPKDVRIDFSGFSEPTFHLDYARMLRYAFDNGYRLVLYTTLFGFIEDNIRLLKGIHFDEVVFHQYPQAGKLFFKKMKIFEENIQPGRVAEITPKWLWSRASNLFDVEYKKGHGKCLFANREFDHNVLLPNGDVYLCCQDYSLHHKLGNLYNQAYDELNRDKIRKLANMEDSKLLCRSCELFQIEK